VLPEGGDSRGPFERRGWMVYGATELAKHDAELKALLEG
jgi:hypothetical protein